MAREEGGCWCSVRVEGPGVVLCSGRGGEAQRPGRRSTSCARSEADEEAYVDVVEEHEAAVAEEHEAEAAEARRGPGRRGVVHVEEEEAVRSASRMGKRLK